jgi:3-hydroxybutyryl-CoA dehydrogenase
MTPPLTLCVIGAGQMGAGIAQVAACSGHAVLLVERTEASLERARASIAGSLDRLCRKGTMSADDASMARGRIECGTDLEALAARADLVIEAIPERLELKAELFQRLDACCPPDTLLASNTSSISITRLAATTRRPDRVLGLHFMNPVPMMSLVEVIRGINTSDTTFERGLAFIHGLGKAPIEARDYPGFVVNRILIPMINEACFTLMEGVATATDIDAAMKLGTNQPMGPLALADLIGLDTCLSILEVLHEGFGDPRYRPCPLLRNLVAAGRLGRKSGRGFHDYPAR